MKIRIEVYSGNAIAEVYERNCISWADAAKWLRRLCYQFWKNQATDKLI